MSATWSFYELATGRFIGCCFSGNESDLPANTAPGCRAMLGRYDHLSQQVDLRTGEVVDWQPLAPQDSPEQTWSWDKRSKRWSAKLTVAGRKPEILARITRSIEAIESGSARAMREALLAQADGQPIPPAALARLTTDELAIRMLQDRLAKVVWAKTHKALDLLNS